MYQSTVYNKNVLKLLFNKVVYLTSACINKSGNLAVIHFTAMVNSIVLCCFLIIFLPAFSNLKCLQFVLDNDDTAVYLNSKGLAEVQCYSIQMRHILIPFSYVDSLDVVTELRSLRGELRKNSLRKSASSKSWIFPQSVPRSSRSSEIHAWQR